MGAVGTSNTVNSTQSQLTQLKKDINTYLTETGNKTITLEKELDRTQAVKLDDKDIFLYKKNKGKNEDTMYIQAFKGNGNLYYAVHGVNKRLYITKSIKGVTTKVYLDKASYKGESDVIKYVLDKNKVPRKYVIGKVSMFDI